MLFPNAIQAALLFDRRVDSLEEAVRTFMRVEQARTGAQFNVPEARPGVFYHLFGGDQLSITFEYLDQPADLAVFQQALASSVTGLVCPDIRQRLTTNKSHVLVNVSHGVLGDSPELLKMLQQIDYPREGHSLPQFLRRLDVCALIARIVGDTVPAQVVHWTQSNQLFPGEAFETLAAAPAPSPLHIHPYLFGQPPRGGEEARVGIRTFGMRHFIGREALIEPSALPWAANFETILAFLRVATMENGYVIPHGETFGPEDRSLSYRVLHRDAEDGDVPLYELEPLMYREYGFVAEDYVPEDRVIDDRSPPLSLMPEGDDAKMQLANEWRERRALAEGIGGRFEVRARGDAPLPAPPAAPAGPPGFGQRPVFGRKQVRR